MHEANEVRIRVDEITRSVVPTSSPALSLSTPKMDSYLEDALMDNLIKEEGDKRTNIVILMAAMTAQFNDLYNKPNNAQEKVNALNQKLSVLRTPTWNGSATEEDIDEAIDFALGGF